MLISSDKNKVLSNTFMLYILQISGYIFPLLTFPYLTRVLGPDKYGIVIYASAFMIYFQMLVDFGFLLSATKECSESRDNLFRLNKIISSVTYAKLILTIIGIILILSILPLPVFAGKRLFILLSYLSVAISVLSPDYLFRGLENMNILTYRTIVTKFIFSICVFMFIKKPENYILIPLINFIGNLLVIFWIWHYIYYQLHLKLILVNSHDCLDALKGSSIFFLSRIASTAWSASNIFILGFYFSNIQMGYFGAANSLVLNMRSLFSPIADSVYPYMVSKKDYRMIFNLLFYSMPIIFISLIFIYIYASPLIRIICGNKYLPSVPIFRLMLPLIFITLPIYLLGFPMLGAFNKMKEANMSVIYAAIFHLIGLLTLIFFKHFNFKTIITLTIISELIVLMIRLIHIITIFKGKTLLHDTKDKINT